MKKYKCEYENGADLKIDNWQMEISATHVENAYDQFIQSVGTHQNKVFVYEANILEGGFYDPDIFERHIEQTEEEIENDNIVNDDPKYLLMQEINMNLKSIKMNQIEQSEKLSKISWSVLGLGVFIIAQVILFKILWS